jgi:hypothetical protein
MRLVSVERAVSAQGKIKMRVRATQLAKVRAWIAKPRNVGVRDEHIQTKPQQRCHLRPTPRLPVTPHELTRAAEDPTPGTHDGLSVRAWNVLDDANQPHEANCAELLGPVCRVE